MQKIIMGIIAIIGIGLLVMLSEVFPGQQNWIQFGALAGIILVFGCCGKKSNEGGA
ncbi:MAG: hypothetical protein KAX28_13275 [Candidatus Marinimicrobia bacterium]|nr:hypothetical protein [Candidatus Neomarinimicrobiota bacterium]